MCLYRSSGNKNEESANEILSIIHKLVMLDVFNKMFNIAPILLTITIKICKKG